MSCLGLPLNQYPQFQQTDWLHMLGYMGYCGHSPRSKGVITNYGEGGCTGGGTNEVLPLQQQQQKGGGGENKF